MLVLFLTISIELVRFYQLAFMCVRQHDVIVFVIEHSRGVIFKVICVIYWVIFVEYLVIIYGVICYLCYFFDFLTLFFLFCQSVVSINNYNISNQENIYV